MAPPSPLRVIVASRRAVANTKRMSSSFASRASLYAHAKQGGFTQEPPQLHNPYREDPVLDRALRRMLPQNEYDKTASDLFRFGDRIVDEIEALGRGAELNKPRLEVQDSWGKRVDKLIVCDEWKKLKRICAEEGLISIGYESSRSAEHRRVHQTAKLFLFAPSAGLVNCPMAMTDGAAKTFMALGHADSHPLARNAFERLTTRDPDRAWTSGQWMTEKKGGSDVAGGCDTYAVHEDGDRYRLHGYKWFSSAVDADMAVALARIVDKEGNALEGSKGLSLFLIKLRDEKGELNGIQMVRLKDKLGTRQLPTAELLLDGVHATLIGPQGRGVPCVASMLNVTRLHNAAASCGSMRRIVNLARDYASRREAFGRALKDWPLHTRTLAALELEVRVCTLFLLETARLVGLQEAGLATAEQQQTVRLLTPVIKAYTAKVCMPLMSEGLECFGGQGYMEDTGIPTLFRDAQVTPIWEGTTNVLSLDVLRVMAGKEDVFRAFVANVEGILSEAERSRKQQLSKCAKAVRAAVGDLGKTLTAMADSALKDSVRIDAGARQILFAIARIYCGALATRHAAGPGAMETDLLAAERYCLEQSLVNVDLDLFKNERVDKDRALIYDNFAPSPVTSKL